MVKRHIVITRLGDSGVAVHPMKDWLRKNPGQIPPGLNPTTDTSWKLRNGLKKLGWTLEETDSEVKLLPPGVDPEPTDDDEEYDESKAESEAAFALEYQLRDFIASNLGSISVGGKRLRLYRDHDGREGVEYPSAIGPIDILAVDETDVFFVFELKRANSSDRAMGQVSRYMGWVKEKLAAGKDVHGVIVAKTIDDKLRYAALMLQNLHLYRYEVEFRLQPSHELRA